MLLIDKSHAGAAAAVLLAACFALRMVEGVFAQAREEPSAVVGNSPIRMSLDRLSATRERPLFSPSRRPPEKSVVRAVAPPPPPPPAPVSSIAPPNLMFFGTFESNEALGAIVQIGEKHAIVRFGSYIEGWRVTEISRHRMVLSLDGRTAVFQLFKSNDTDAQPSVRQIPQILQNPKGG
jgi:hypothetical protein